jgi:hypothetical protein
MLLLDLDLLASVIYSCMQYCDLLLQKRNMTWHSLHFYVNTTSVTKCLRNNDAVEGSVISHLQIH